MANQLVVKVIREPVRRLRPRIKRSSRAATKGPAAMQTRVTGPSWANTLPVINRSVGLPLLWIKLTSDSNRGVPRRPTGFHLRDNIGEDLWSSPSN